MMPWVNWKKTYTRLLMPPPWPVAFMTSLPLAIILLPPEINENYHFMPQHQNWPFISKCSETPQKHIYLQSPQTFTIQEAGLGGVGGWNPESKIKLKL